VLAGCGADVELYAEGVRRADGHVASSSAAGREDGAWTWWFPNGERREQGTLDHGRRIGEWTQWYPNGQRRSRGSRLWNDPAHASLREGLWTFWYENGVVQGYGLYHAGMREGHWDYSLDDGSLDGDRTGEYHEDERLQ
jgi:antitoxin component YwqK of YwqJK toxin-antitoxin module